MQWVDEICGTCKFNIDGMCRKNPPSIYKRGIERIGELNTYVTPDSFSYPEVMDGTSACSQWRDRNTSTTD